MPDSPNRESWFELRTLFDEAKDLSAERQEEYLRQHAGGKPDLQQKVRDLLRAHRDSASLLDRPLPDRLRGLDQGPPLAATLPDDLTGVVLRDRYTVQRLLRQGGSSRIYLASDAQFEDRKVVVKQILPREGGGTLSAAVFQAEIAALSRLHHPGMTRPLDSGLTLNGDPFLVLDYIPGPTLRELIDAGPLPLARALRLLDQIAGALIEAHSLGIIHLDLKPENIVVRGGTPAVEQAVLLDFGIAQRLSGAGAGEPRTLGGSPAYMAPEQLAGRPTAASDQYALALIVRELLGPATRRREAVLRRALSPDPSARFASVPQFMDALHAALPGAGGRRAWVLRSVIAALLLLLALLASRVWFTDGSLPAR
jgi:eukaryotic-like serine/threonine-protein kinase